MVSVTTIMSSGAHLLSEDGENPEYDRGIVELVNSLLGLTSDDKENVELELRDLQSQFMGKR